MRTLPGIGKKILKSYILSALTPIRLWSRSAENLLLGTCAQESHFGRYIAQIGDGPARGIFQMEPATYYDILNHSDLIVKRSILLPADANMLIYDIRLAIIAARLKYSMVPEKLPEANDLEGLAEYWKKYYNTKLGKGTVEEFIANYNKYVTSEELNDW
jgi:hypothetical protein